MPGRLTPASFSLDRVRDPRLRPLMSKVRVREDNEFTRRYPSAQGARIELRTRSGRRFSRESLYPKGHYRNPLSDRELEEKFHGLTAAILSDERRRLLLDELWRMESLENLDTVFRYAKPENGGAGR